MSSSAIVAMFIPVVLTIANRSGLNRKRMLMPLSVAALVSGMMTLIASSPNMIIENTLRARGLAPLGFFAWTPFGVAVLAIGIAFMLLGRWPCLSKQLVAEKAGAASPSAYDLVGFYGLTDRFHRLQVPANSPLIGQSVAQMQQLYDDPGVVLLGFEKHLHRKTRFLPALPETVCEPDDAIFVVGSEDQMLQLIESQDLIELPRLDETQRAQALQEIGVAEIMLAPELKLIGKTLRRTGIPLTLPCQRAGHPSPRRAGDDEPGQSDARLWRHAAGGRRLGQISGDSGRMTATLSCSPCRRNTTSCCLLATGRPLPLAFSSPWLR